MASLVHSSQSRVAPAASDADTQRVPSGWVSASARQIQQWLLAGEGVLVDVREPDEHARERILGSHSMPLSQFDPARAVGLAKPGQRLVVHCRGGARSEDAARRAAALGGRGGEGVTIVSMAGGLEAWKKDNLPVETNSDVSRISVMRQVQLVIGSSVLAGAALAWFVHPAFIGVPAFFGAGLVFAGATGTCALASLLGRMPWNTCSPRGAQNGSCASGQCG